MKLLLGSLQDAAPAASIRDHLPDWMLNTIFFLETWQWLGVFALAFLGIVLEKIVTFGLQRILRRFLNQFEVEVDPSLLRSGSRS